MGAPARFNRARDIGVRDLLLCMLSLSSGAVDAVSFITLGRVFTAFMSGNIAFLGLRVAGTAGAPAGVAVLVSMGGFAVGAYLATLIARPSAVSGPWPRLVTAALGVSLIAHAGFLTVWFASDGVPSRDATNVLLALWGIAMGIQSVAVRALHVEGVYTTAATATFMFLMGDVANWPATGAQRRLLAGVLVSLFIGATAGGLLLVHAHKYAPVLPFALTLAAVATAWFMLPERGRASVRAT